jgi:hypothetical protein
LLSEEDSEELSLSEDFGTEELSLLWLISDITIPCELLSEELSVISGSSEQPEHKRRARTVMIIKNFFI